MGKKKIIGFLGRDAQQVLKSAKRAEVDGAGATEGPGQSEHQGEHWKQTAKCLPKMNHKEREKLEVFSLSKLFFDVF